MSSEYLHHSGFGLPMNQIESSHDHQVEVDQISAVEPKKKNRPVNGDSVKR